MRKEPICSECGSFSVIGEAAVEWDGEDWVICNVYDEVTCQECGNEGYPSWEKVKCTKE